jgi:hypothetical protein
MAIEDSKGGLETVRCKGSLSIPTVSYGSPIFYSSSYCPNLCGDRGSLFGSAACPLICVSEAALVHGAIDRAGANVFYGIFALSRIAVAQSFSQLPSSASPDELGNYATD